MAVIKPRPDDLFRCSLVPLSGELYDVLLDKLKNQLKRELALITANALRAAIKNCADSGETGRIIAVLPRNIVRLTVFVQSASLGDEGVEFETRLSLPVLGTPPEHQAIWKSLLHKQFPWHVFPDGELLVGVNVPEAGVLRGPSGVFDVRSENCQAA